MQPVPPLPAAPASSAPAAAVPPPATPSLSGLSTLAVGVVVIAALYFGREVFVPIVLAVLLSFVLMPLVNLLRRLHLGRVFSSIAAVLLALGIILAVGGVIGNQVVDLATNLPRYQATVEQKVSNLQQGLFGRASALFQRVSREVRNVSDQASPQAPAQTAPRQEGDAPKPMLVEVRERDASPLDVARSVLGPLVQPITTTGIVLVVVIFLLLQREDLRDRLIRLFGSNDLHRTTAAMDDAAKRLSTYFLTQLALNAGFGVLVAAGLWLIGVPSPILWGIFSALMRFVPYIGGFISAVPPLVLAAAVDPGWSMVVWTLALFLVTEPVMGQMVEPLVYGHSTGLSPFAVVVSTLFWAWLWGPIGLILATPFTVCLVVLGRHVERLEFLDVLLGDRPALTPVENFYQRMLAGDPDEAQAHAEQLLKTSALSSYYDEVALRGLQLAANDAQRGVLRPSQVERIKTAIKELVDDLDGHEDVKPAVDAAKKAAEADETLAEAAVSKKDAVPGQAPERASLPPPWDGEAPVLCIAGRGPLDEAASAMLAQLLGKHGLGARLVPHEAVSRSNIRSLDLSGVGMICISYLDIRGNPAHLRYLLRRLREKAPGTPLLVGLWPAEDAVLSDPAMRSQIGADHYVSSLREAVEACLSVSHSASEDHGMRESAGELEVARA
ncbi:MAG TPA: AI-2E family transporter [Enterovirga sp.]|jgi:predicted PurR-regulated permease PerM|nr:AI-2E family transporter [Enterovirga sp.]